MLKYINYNIVFQEIPNEITLAINLTNCPNNCKNCHSEHLKQNIGKELNVDIINELLLYYGDYITCFCFMGGDSKPKDVEFFAKYIKNNYKNIKTAWYSGKNNFHNNVNISNFNFIKIGNYNEAKGGLNNIKTNQKFFKISNNGVIKDITYKFWN